MSGSHEKLPGLFWVQLVAAAIVGILWLFAPGEGGQGTAAEAKVDPTMAAALKPIGNVAVAKPAAEAGALRSGEAIVEKNCKVCHAIGLANAPKLDASAKADWQARLAGGHDALVASAIKGKGGMPPRGGDPTLTDDEISSAVQAMLSTVGVETAEAKAPESAAPAKVAAASETKSETSKAETTKAEPAKQAVAVVETPKPAETAVKATAVTAAAAATKPAVAVASKKPVAAEAKQAQSANAKPVAIAVTELGESTYKSSCFACHDSGVANSPKFGDKAVWSPRIAQGIASLHTAAIKGKGAMPGKGGNPALSEKAVMEAVDYMAS